MESVKLKVHGSYYFVKRTQFLFSKTADRTLFEVSGNKISEVADKPPIKFTYTRRKAQGGKSST